MSDFPEPPPETWLAIFAHLPQSDIANVSLLNHSFRILAQPLLFSSITLCPCGANDRGEITPLSNNDRKTLCDKLTFCEYPHILAGLTRCTITLPGQIYTTSSADFLTVKPNLHDIFHTLTRLTNIKEIRLAGIHIVPSYLTQMLAMPSLESLVLTSCDAAMVGCQIGLPLANVSVDGEFIASPLPLLRERILKPSHLRKLHLTWCSGMIISELAIRGPWPALRQLTVESTSDVRSLFAHFLHQCPALEDLHLSIDEVAVAFLSSLPPLPKLSISPDVVPRLITYCGPLDTVAEVMTGRAIRHLGITSNSRAPVVEHTLTSLGSAVCARIETLQILLYSFSPGLLPTIAKQCPNVRVLHLWPGGWTWAPPSIPTTYMTYFLQHAVFPRQVEEVYIKLNPTQHADVLPMEVDALRELARSYPALHDFAIRIRDNSILHFDPATGATIDGNQVHQPPSMGHERGFPRV